MLTRLKFLSGSNDHRIVTDLMKGGITRRKAEDDLFNSYSYYIREAVKKYAIREEDCFDAYSDTILSVIYAVTDGRFEQRSSLKTFIYRIFHHKCVDIIRKSSTNKESVNRATALPESMFELLSDNTKSILQTLIERFDLDEMHQKLQKLGESCKSMLTMFAEGYSDKLIAEALHYNSPDVVKTSRLRCLQKLRQAYAIHLKNER
jgi:RNA polymerase sigma factor (sigma-70 family)